MCSTLTFAPPALCLASPPPNPRSTRTKPRAPPSFSERRTAPRPWRSVDDPEITAVATALEQWRQRTSHPPGHLPSDSHLRRCDTARDLRLHSLIVRAGGYKNVQNRLGLKPFVSPNQKELEKIAEALKAVCKREGRKLTIANFPQMREIRRMDPKLGNRIAALPGRNGWHKLRGLYGVEFIKNAEKRREWRVWTDPERIRTELLAYQAHPQVLPRLCALPSEIGTAIQRQGGANMFVKKFGMVLEKDWANLKRFSRLVRWLATEARQDTAKMDELGLQAYLSIVRGECENAPNFPTMERFIEEEMANDLQRYGGRKGLACRLGFERASCLRDVFLGPFSVTYAADILEYAAMQVDVGRDCSVAMPSIHSLKMSGRHDLAAATIMLGGEDVVGRRLGLVPK